MSVGPPTQTAWMYHTFSVPAAHSRTISATSSLLCWPEGRFRYLGVATMSARTMGDLRSICRFSKRSKSTISPSGS